MSLIRICIFVIVQDIIALHETAVINFFVAECIIQTDKYMGIIMIITRCYFVQVVLFLFSVINLISMIAFPLSFQALRWCAVKKKLLL